MASSYVVVYPKVETNSSSLTIYVISVPFSYFGKFLYVYVQLSLVVALALVNVTDVTSTLSAPSPLYNLIVIDSGRNPSLLLSSFQIFSTLILISFGVCLLIML